MSRSISVDSLLAGNASLMPAKSEEVGLQNISLGELCISLTRGVSISSEMLMFYNACDFSDIVAIGTGSYKDHELQLWNATFLCQCLDEWKKGEVRPGDLLISKTITPPKAFVMDFPEDAKVIADSNLFILKLDTNRIDPVYLMAYLNTNEGQEQLKSKAAGNSRIKAIPIDGIRSLMIPVLPMNDQKELAVKFTDKIRSLKYLKEQLEVVEDSLLDLYSNGYTPDNSAPPHVFKIMERELEL